jgi:hypothetical protein
MESYHDSIGETSTSTGTGALTLAGAQIGHLAFSTLPTGITFPYAIWNEDVPSEWEVGIGSISGSTLRRGLTDLEITSGRTLHLDATTISASDGDAISSWTDLSGNGNHAVQATGSKQPLYKTGIQNGLPVVRFDGSDDQLDAPISADATVTLFIVAFKRTAAGGSAKVLVSFGGSWVIYTNTGDGAGWLIYDGFVRSLGSTPTTATLLGAVFNSTASYDPYVNGVVGTNFNPDDGYSTQTELRIGGWDSQWGDYDIGEIILYNSALSSTDREKVENYLMLKWLPSISTPRILSSSNTNDTVNFSAGTKRVYLTLPAAKATLPDIQTFTSNGTWIKPPGAVNVTAYLIGQGGGGGAGGRGPAGNVRRGGGGGAGGAVTMVTLAADDLGATESVVVGSAANGGAAQTVDSTDGATGTAGTATQFGTKVYAPGGSGGQGGGFNNTGGAAGAAVGVTSHFQQVSVAGGAAAAAGGTGGTGTTSTTGVPTGGGAASGITSADADSSGAGNGGSLSQGIVAVTTAGGSAASGGTGSIGGNGNSYPWLFGTTLGTGGGGGRSSKTAAGGAGGNGGNYGAGGGGGGASLNGNASGAGGNGGGGICVVVSW